MTFSDWCLLLFPVIVPFQPAQHRSSTTSSCTRRAIFLLPRHWMTFHLAFSAEQPLRICHRGRSRGWSPPAPGLVSLPVAGRLAFPALLAVRCVRPGTGLWERGSAAEGKAPQRPRLRHSPDPRSGRRRTAGPPAGRRRGPPARPRRRALAALPDAGPERGGARRVAVETPGPARRRAGRALGRSGSRRRLAPPALARAPRSPPRWASAQGSPAAREARC